MMPFFSAKATHSSECSADPQYDLHASPLQPPGPGLSWNIFAFSASSRVMNPFWIAKDVHSSRCSSAAQYDLHSSPRHPPGPGLPANFFAAAPAGPRLVTHHFCALGILACHEPVFYRERDAFLVMSGCFAVLFALLAATSSRPGLTAELLRFLELVRGHQAVFLSECDALLRMFP